MKLIRCWTMTTVVAAAMILTGPRPLAADEIAPPSGDLDSPDLSDTDLRDFRVSVLGLFNSGRYADLDTLAQQLQQQRSRFKGGALAPTCFLRHTEFAGFADGNRCRSMR